MTREYGPTKPLFIVTMHEYRDDNNSVEYGVEITIYKGKGFNYDKYFEQLLQKEHNEVLAEIDSAVPRENAAEFLKKLKDVQ